MQPHEAFKLGFLARCVEEGFTPEQTVSLAKKAEDMFVKNAFVAEISRQLTDPVKNTADAARSVVGLGSSLLPYGLAVAAIPPAVGALAAYAKNKATDVGEDEVDLVKKRELIDTYSRMSDELKRQKERQDYKQQRKRTGRVFL